jgi:tripartite-type tricarboxylate transporter receptor subunit TctC
MPAVPTLSDFMPGCGAIGWNGVGIPAGTSVEIIRKLNHEINLSLACPGIKARFS